MGLSDKFKNMAKQAQESVAANADKLHDAVENVGVAVNEQTGGKYARHIQKVGDKASGAIDKVGGQPDAASATAAPAAGPEAGAPPHTGRRRRELCAHTTKRRAELRRRSPHPARRASVMKPLPHPSPPPPRRRRALRPRAGASPASTSRAQIAARAGAASIPRSSNARGTSEAKRDGSPTPASDSAAMAAVSIGGRHLPCASEAMNARGTVRMNLSATLRAYPSASANSEDAVS